MNELIRIGLHRYSADRIAKFDFALENSGGGVVDSSDTYPPALNTYSVMGMPLWTAPSSPKAIIQVGYSLLLFLSDSPLPSYMYIHFPSLIFSLVYILVTAGP